MNQSPAPELGRTLKARHVTMISIGGVIGAGLFVGSGAAISAAGPAIVVSYLAAGTIIFLVMRMLCEMAAAFPQSAIFTEYIRAGLGHWAGFLSGWLYWYFWVVVVAIEAIAGANILALWFPIPPWQIGLALMALLTAVNLMSTRAYGEFEFWFASIKVAAIMAFIVLGFSALSGFLPVQGAGFANLTAHGGFAPEGWSAVAAGIVSVIFALTGVEITTVAAAESQASPQYVSKLAISVVLRIVLFYVLSILLIVMILPWTSVKPQLSPFALALERLEVPWVSTIMNLVVLTAVLSCLNSGIYVTSRVLFSLAARGDAPQSLVKLSRRGVPVRAILLGSSLGYVAVLLSVVSASRLFTFLVNASGALMVFIYLLVVFAHVRLRYRIESQEPARLTLRMWAFPWLSYGVAAVLVTVLAFMLSSDQRAAELYASLFCVAIVGIAWFFRSRITPRPVDQASGPKS